MRRHDVGPILVVCALPLAACASSALDFAPDRPDRPWTPATNSAGEILPGERAPPGSAPSRTYVLPSNPPLGALSPPPALDPSHVYTLAELIDVAQSNNPDTRVAWDEARNAALAAGIAKSVYLPNVTGSIIGGHQSFHGGQTVSGISTPNNGSADGVLSAVSLQWLLFDFGKRSATVDAATQVSVISNIAFTAAHQEVIYRVTLAFYADAAARAHVASAQEALRNAQNVQAAAEDRYKRGIGTIVEVAQAREATAQARLSDVRANGIAQDVRLSLLYAMGISPFTKINVVDISDRPLSPAVIKPIEQVVSEALARRPDVASAYAAHQASLAAIRAAEAEFWPKLFLSATGSYASGDLSVTALPGIAGGSPTLNVANQRFGTTVLLGVTVPLFDGGTRDALLKQAQSNEDKATVTLAKVRDDAVRQVVTAGNATKTNFAAFEASQALASAAQTTYDAALAAYRRAFGSITDVTIAETQLVQAKNASIDAYYATLTAAATLALSAGTLGAAPEP